MRAGKLDRTLTIESATYTVDDAGTPTPNWSTVATLRAQQRQNDVADEMRDFGASNEATITFRTRFCSGVTTECRATYAGEPYDIVRIVEIGRRRGLDLTLKRIAAP